MYHVKGKIEYRHVRENSQLAGFLVFSQKRPGKNKYRDTSFCVITHGTATWRRVCCFLGVDAGQPPPLQYPWPALPCPLLPSFETVRFSEECEGASPARKTTKFSRTTGGVCTPAMTSKPGRRGGPRRSTCARGSSCRRATSP